MNDDLITKNVSEMLPSIADPNIEELNTNHIKISYLFYFGYDPMELKCEINKFPTIEEAEKNYSDVKKQYDSISIIRMRRGYKGFGIEKKYDSGLVFIKKNVVVIIRLDGKYSSLDQVINYSKKINI